jgi:hypothetical protein
MGMMDGKVALVTSGARGVDSTDLNFVLETRINLLPTFAVMLASPDLLDMVRQLWKAARPQGWLFPRRPAINPLTTRRLNRLFHLAALGCRDQEGRNTAQLAKGSSRP